MVGWKNLLDVTVAKFWQTEKKAFYHCLGFATFCEDYIGNKHGDKNIQSD